MTGWSVRDAKPRTAWSEWEGSGPHRVRGERHNPHEFLKSLFDQVDGTKLTVREVVLLSGHQQRVPEEQVDTRGVCRHRFGLENRNPVYPGAG